jgi:hypothetical protein
VLIAVVTVLGGLKLGWDWLQTVSENSSFT